MYVELLFLKNSVAVVEIYIKNFKSEVVFHWSLVVYDVKGCIITLQHPTA